MAALPEKCEPQTWMDLLKEQARIAKFMFAFRYVGITKTPQKKVASVVGTSFQQIQKVEKTENGLSSDKLFLLCRKKKWDINTIFQKDPIEMLEHIKKEYHNKVLAHFKLVDLNIEKERQQQLRYRPVLPKLEKELSYVNTFTG